MLGNTMKVSKLVIGSLFAVVLAGCAQTDVQPISKTSFMVATTAAPACGRSGARKVANQAAAIEVIKRGGDRFLFVDQSTGSRITGMSYTGYGGWNTYNSNEQNLVVQMVSRGQKGYSDSLSAKEVLGPDWQEMVASGTPQTCTS